MSDPLQPTDDQLDALTVEVQAIGVRHISDREAALYLWRLIAPMVLDEIIRYVKLRRLQAADFGEAHDCSLLTDLAVRLKDGS